jgi:hypothetical protein
MTKKIVFSKFQIEKGNDEKASIMGTVGCEKNDVRNQSSSHHMNVGWWRV